MEAKQESRWQDNLITYGCLVRLFFISATSILIPAAVIIWILHLGGEAWSTALGGIFAGLGVLLAVFQWLFPLSPIDPKSFHITPPNSEQAYNTLFRREEKLLKKDGHNSGATGTLIVRATWDHRGKRVYLLPLHRWYQLQNYQERDKSGEKIYAIVTCRRIND
jgi:hypothetical protein